LELEAFLGSEMKWSLALFQSENGCMQAIVHLPYLELNEDLSWENTPVCMQNFDVETTYGQNHLGRVSNLMNIHAGPESEHSYDSPDTFSTENRTTKRQQFPQLPLGVSYIRKIYRNLPSSTERRLSGAFNSAPLIIASTSLTI